MGKARKVGDGMVSEGTKNVFADLGISMSQEDMAKVHIAMEITATIGKTNLTQSQAAKIMDTDQAKVSAILRGRLGEFSIGRLIVFLLKLGRDVELHVSRRNRNRPGALKVKAA